MKEEPQHAVSPAVESNVRNKVGVIGGGLIGGSWAALLAAYGHSVSIWDSGAEWIARTERRVESALAQLKRLGAAGPGQVVYASSPVDAVRDASWVFECVSEDLAIKARVFETISGLARADAIVSSSTSSYTWSQLAPLVSPPDRFITAHPFNPPHLMPLVEIFADSRSIALRAFEFFRRLGRRPILLKRDVVGHVANRLASALWREAVYLLAEGIADVADIDSAVVNGPGLRWSAVGPHMAYHLGGGSGGIRGYLHHLGDSQVRRWQDLGDPELTLELKEALAGGIDEEANGRSIDALALERDELLISALLARRQITDPSVT